MKKILLVLSIIIISNKSYSQLYKLNSIVYPNNFKATFLYDEEQNTLSSGFEWNSSTNEWDELPLSEQYFYNDEDFTDYTLYQGFSDNHKNVFSYNSSNQVTELLIYEQDGTDWQFYYKVEIIYDASDNPIERVFSIWSDANWIYSYKSIDTFDSNHNLVISEDSQWDTSTSLWSEIQQKSIFTYNADNKLLSEIRSHLEDDGTFKEDSKLEYTYLSNGNREQYIRFEYDLASNSWSNYQKITYVYNNDYSFSNLILPNKKGHFEVGYDNHVDYNHMITSISKYEWDETLNQWNETENSPVSYNWEETTLAISNLNSIDIGVYPNPVSKTLNFELSNTIYQIDIFDIQGKLLLSRCAMGNKKINVSELNKGIYIYKINNRINGKFIKE